VLNDKNEKNKQDKEQMDRDRQQLDLMESLQARLSDGEAREDNLFMGTWLRIFCDELSTVWQLTSGAYNGGVIETVQQMAGVGLWTW
jgi:hypothetical protein